MLRALAEMQREVQTACGGEGIRWLSQAQMHLTLRFLGGVPAAPVAEWQPALRAAVGDARAFELSIAGLGCFPHARRPRVLWAGVHGDREALRKVQERIADATARWGEPEVREFHPHLTLARIKAGARFDSRRWQQLERLNESRNLGGWRVTSVELMRRELASNGAVYSTLGTFPLGRKFHPGSFDLRPRRGNATCISQKD